MLFSQNIPPSPSPTEESGGEGGVRGDRDGEYM